MLECTSLLRNHSIGVHTVNICIRYTDVRQKYFAACVLYCKSNTIFIRLLLTNLLHLSFEVIVMFKVYPIAPPDYLLMEGGHRCKKSTLNDLVHLTPLRIPLMNPPPLFRKSQLRVLRSSLTNGTTRKESNDGSRVFSISGRN